jgi:eukaryotic-like serine/threonine-protein kinase
VAASEPPGEIPSVLREGSALLSSGTKVGAYEVIGAIGAGGMGEVYRARDTRLGRDVALKVLPEAFARDAERLARFRREAQVLASLNHPNIAAIYGFEESGSTHALVMELVEGPTLAEKISGALNAGGGANADLKVAATKNIQSEVSRAGLKAAPTEHPFGGAIAIDEALPMAKQICEALEYAHERGIVHRDLKPANIKLASNDKIAQSDAVKILDFGLAKALEGDPASMDISSSPTITRMATQAGIILGTAAYMSPEQAKGKSVDRRTDIWAFGCVLYEMLTGKMAFTGETATDTLAAVIRAEPEWTLLPANMPTRLRELLQRCLKKDARQRLQSVGDARITLEEILSGAATQSESAPSSGINASLQIPAPSPRWRSALPWAIVALLVIVLAAFVVTDLTRKPPEEDAFVSQIPPPKGAQFMLAGGAGGAPVISPDGREIAFVAAESSGQPKLWVQALDSETAQPLAGTDGAAYPFWSADSRSIGYFAHGMMNRIDASGGPPESIAPASFGRGASWGKNGIILYSPTQVAGLYSVPASGGTPRELTFINKSGSTSDRWPQFLPDGKHFLFYSEVPTHYGTYVGSLAGSKPTLLIRGNSNAIYSPPGYLLFIQQGTLMAQQFDAKSLQLMGEAKPIAVNVPHLSTMSLGEFSVSQTGILTYAQGGSEAGLRQLVWYDRNGKQVGPASPPGGYFTLALSPDGKQVALTEQSPGQADVDVWVYDLARGTNTKLTFGTVDVQPAWSPDGKMIAFLAIPQGSIYHLYEKASDGSGDVKTLLADDADENWPVWTPDGRDLVFTRYGTVGTHRSIWALPLDGVGKPFAVMQNPQFDIDEPAVSPNGKWVAYVSSQSGQFEVYISPFLQGSGLWQVSSGGGEMPEWEPDGKELFYVSPDHKIMSAEISEHGSAIAIGKATALFTVDLAGTPGGRTYAVGPRGQKFLAITSVEGTGPEGVTLVVNWPALVKRQ